MFTGELCSWTRFTRECEGQPGGGLRRVEWAGGAARVGNGGVVVFCLSRITVRNRESLIFGDKRPKKRVRFAYKILTL